MIIKKKQKNGFYKKVNNTYYQYKIESWVEPGGARENWLFYLSNFKEIKEVLTAFTNNISQLNLITSYGQYMEIFVISGGKTLKNFSLLPYLSVEIINKSITTIGFASLLKFDEEIKTRKVVLKGFPDKILITFREDTSHILYDSEGNKIEVNDLETWLAYLSLFFSKPPLNLEPEKREFTVKIDWSFLEGLHTSPKNNKMKSEGICIYEIEGPVEFTLEQFFESFRNP